jgi:hypothetical protein
MLEPMTVEFRERLRRKRITNGELVSLLELAMRDSRTVFIDAQWPHGQRARFENSSSLSGIANPQQLELLRLFVFYSDDSTLSLDFIDRDQEVRANRGHGIERAHKFRAQYNSIPSRRKLASTARTVLGLSVLALLFLAFSSLSRRVLGGDSSIIVVVLFPLLALNVLSAVLNIVVHYFPAANLWEKLLPARTTVIPESVPWFRNPIVISAVPATISALAALLTVALRLWG